MPLEIGGLGLGHVTGDSVMQTDDTSLASPSPQEQVMGAAIGLWQGRCVITAVELGLADVLADGPLSVDTVAAQTDADADNLFRVMRALETIGIFKQVSPRVFENTPTSECLRKDVPGSQCEPYRERRRANDVS